MLQNDITFFIRHIVYRNRNISIKRGDNILIILKNKVKYYMKKDLTEKFYVAKSKGEINKFKDTFLIDECLGKIHTNELEIMI